MYKKYFSGLLFILILSGCSTSNLEVNNNSPSKPVIEGVKDNNCTLPSKEGCETKVKLDSKLSKEEKADKKLEAELHLLKHKLKECGVIVEFYPNEDSKFVNQIKLFKNLLKVCKQISPYAKGYIIHASLLDTKKGYGINNSIFLPYNFSAEELLKKVKALPQKAPKPGKSN